MTTIDRGLYHYEITGEREAEAAEALEARLDWIDQQKWYPYNRAEDYSSARQKTEEEFGVKIKTAI